MVIGVRMEPELERRLDQLAQQLGKSRSACIREAIRQYALRHGDDEEARRQSQLLAALEAPNWSERVPDWSDCSRSRRTGGALVAALRRGTVVTVASAGVYSGKPRPAVVVQADRWLQAHPSVTLCPLTSTLIEAPLVRIGVTPSPVGQTHQQQIHIRAAAGAAPRPAAKQPEAFGVMAGQ